MRWMVRLAGVLAALLALAVAALFLIPTERVAAIAAERFEAATGRALTIDGSVRPSFWPVIGARLEDVRLANAPWSDSGPMLEAVAIDLGLDLRALIGGDIVITRLEAVAPRILLERDADGNANWEFAGNGATPAAGGEARALSLDLAQVTDGSLRIRDRAAGVDLVLEALDLEMRLPDLAGPGEIVATGRRNGQGFAAEARIEVVQRLLDGAVTPVALALRAGGSTLRFDGRAGIEPAAAEGRLVVEGDGLGPLLALAGQGADEPLPAEMRPVSVHGQVTLAPEGSVHLREGVLMLGENRLTASLDLSNDGPRPRLTGDIAAESLDLTALTAGAGDDGGGDGGGEWSRAPIDASAIGALDAALSVRAGAVETGFGQIAPLRVDVTLDRARAVFDLRDVRMHDGRIAGEFVINNRAGLSVGGNLRAEEVSLEPLLQAVAGIERLAGTGDAQLRFLGVGQSMDAIMRSLSGEGRLDLGRGEIVGLDLVGMLRNLDMSYVGDRNTTVFDTLTGSFAIDGGVLRNQDLNMEVRAIAVSGRGAIDLGARTLDYRLTPTAFRDPETGREIQVPLHVTGPWDEPRYRLDLAGLAEERLREERARLEERTRAELERRLGVERQEGQSGREALQEGVRQRLDDEIGRGLQRLLRSRD
jgi:AsmA protein